MSQGRTKKAIVNMSFNIANQIINILLQFISRSFFIWGFGIEYLGINGLFTDVLGLLSMADLGLGIAMAYSFYEPLAKNNKKKICGLVTFYRQVYIVIAIVVTVVGLMIMPILPYLIKLEQDIPNLEIYYILSLANIVASYVFVYKATLLTADQKNYIISKITIVTNILKTVIQIVSIILFKNYVLYLVIGTISILVNNICTSRVASKKYPYIDEKEKISLEEKKEIFSSMSSVFIYKVANVLLTATDNILISAIIGTVTVGFFSNYLLVQTKLTSIYALIFTSVTASVGNLIVTESTDKRLKIFNMEQSVSFIICGIVVPCYITLINDFIGVWLGTAYILNNHVVMAIGFNMYLSCVLQPLWSYREATGLYKKTKWIMVVCAALNLVLSVILAYKIGLAGIIFASGLSKILTYICLRANIIA